MTLRGTVTILIYTPHAETQRPPFPEKSSQYVALVLLDPPFSNTSPEKSDPLPTGNLLPPFWELEKNPPRKME